MKWKLRCIWVGVHGTIDFNIIIRHHDDVFYMNVIHHIPPEQVIDESLQKSNVSVVLFKGILHPLPPCRPIRRTGGVFLIPVPKKYPMNDYREELRGIVSAYKRLLNLPAEANAVNTVTGKGQELAKEFLSFFSYYAYSNSLQVFGLKIPCTPTKMHLSFHFIKTSSW